MKGEEGKGGEGEKGKKGQALTTSVAASSLERQGKG